MKQYNYLNLLEELDLRKGFADLATSAVKAGAGAVAQEFLPDLGAAALQSVMEETLKTFAGFIIGPFFKFLLNVSNRMSAKLDKQIRAPFKTGVRVAQEALALQCKNADEVRYRDEKLKFAVEELDRAWTLSEETPTQTQDQFLIRMIQGFCAKERSGGSAEAQQKIGECISLLEGELQEMREASEKLSSEISALEKEAGNYRRAYMNSMGDRQEMGGLLGFASGYSAKARKLEDNRRKLIHNIIYLNDIIAMLNAI